MERMIVTPDGRQLRVEEAGDPAGVPVLMHHGTPGAGHLYRPHVTDAINRGIRLIGYNRPGYGRSTPQPGRSVADCAADVRAIASELGIDRLGVWGISGGGPHALACAALLPDLVVAVGSLAAIAPYGAPGLDFFTGMGQENVDDVKLSLEDEPAARAKLGEDRERMLALTAEDMVQAFPTLVSAVDAAALDLELGEYLVACDQDGLGLGGDGWWDDGHAHLHPWGFDLESIRVPVQLWHGRHDRFVPFQHGEWLASKIPGVEAHLTDEDGHLTLLQRRVGEVHAWLLDHF
ncbi:MAG TPA: alpha/beta hydrolase [Candidatus Dormibacteraeota bacterium]|nr:alpha/beta hydrolase [Candidatus Dormibacteraeota bacterium]